MLILPNGYAEFNQKVWHTESGKNLRPRRNWERDGFQPTKEYDKRQDIQPDEILAWVLPGNFCPDCGNTSVMRNHETMCSTKCLCGTQGIFQFETPRPDLHMRKWDKVVYQRCGSCTNTVIYGNKAQPALMYGGNAYEYAQMKQQERVQKRIEEWIRARISAGDEPVVKGNEW